MSGNIGSFESSLSENGDITYFAESNDKGVTYGVICIQLADTNHPMAEAEILLTKFMNSLHIPFKIEHNSGAQFSAETTGQTSITDYWQDKNKADWKVKGFTNGEVIAVLYVKNISDTAVSKIDAFLDGFRFKTK